MQMHAQAFSPGTTRRSTTAGSCRPPTGWHGRLYAEAYRQNYTVFSCSAGPPSANPNPDLETSHRLIINLGYQCTRQSVRRPMPSTKNQQHMHCYPSQGFDPADIQGFAKLCKRQRHRRPAANQSVGGRYDAARPTTDASSAHVLLVLPNRGI